MAKKTNIRLPGDATTKRASRQVKRAAKGLPRLTTKEIIAARLGCAPDELLAYVEKPGLSAGASQQPGSEQASVLIIAIAPDGRKYKFIEEEV